MIIRRMKTYAVCPHCQADAGQVDHLLGQTMTTAWYCETCGGRYALAFTADGVTISKAPGRRIVTTNLLVLRPQSHPVFFFVRGMRFEGNLDESHDREESARFYYEEHSCPTNWLRPEMVYYDGDADPHGLLEYVTQRDVDQLPDDEDISPNAQTDALVALIEAHVDA